MHKVFMITQKNLLYHQYLFYWQKKGKWFLFENAPELKCISSSHYHFVSDGKVLIKCYSGVLEALYSNIIPASLQTNHTTNKCIDSKGIEVNDCAKIIH